MEKLRSLLHSLNSLAARFIRKYSEQVFAASLLLFFFYLVVEGEKLTAKVDAIADRLNLIDLAILGFYKLAMLLVVLAIAYLFWIKLKRIARPTGKYLKQSRETQHYLQEMKKQEERNKLMR